MTRKAVADSGKRDEIVTAAMDCFLKKGYDGTSVRSIMKKAGGEVGLFYYYFDSKDDVFDKVLDRFFARYQKDFAQIADSAYRDPFRALTCFFEYMKAETLRFRNQYSDKVHRTVRWAIRERTLTIIVPYLRQILGVLALLGAKPPLDLNVTAVILSHGVGSMILHEDSDWIEQYTAETKKAVYLMMGLDMNEADLMFPIFPVQEDIPSIVRLAEEMKEQFPGFCKTDFEVQLRQKIQQQEAFIIRCRDETVGCILFSHEKNEIDFLGVRHSWRKHGVATRLLVTAMAQFPAGTTLSVITYREGDPLGIGARRLYLKFGFEPGELLMVFDYPCQRLTVSTPARLPAAKLITIT